MKVIILLVLQLVISVSAAEESSRSRVFGLSIANITKVSLQSRWTILAGNAKGELQLYNSYKKASKVAHFHQEKIIQIKQYGNKRKRQWVTVDESGLIVIWDHKFEDVLHHERVVAAKGNKIVDVAVSLGEKRHGRHYSNSQNLVALTDGSKVYEYSLQQLALKRTIETNLTDNIVSIVYIGHDLVVSIQAKGLFIAEDQDTVFRELEHSEANLTLLASHEQFGGYDRDGIAVKDHSTVIHFNREGFQPDQIGQMFPNKRITSLQQCKNTQKRQVEDLMLVGFSDGTLVIRNFQGVFEQRLTNSNIVDITCQDDDVLYVDDQGNVALIDLDHLEHSRIRFSGLAGMMFSIFAVSLFVYLLIKQKRTRKDTKGGQPREPKEIEMQERIAYQPPSL